MLLHVIVAYAALAVLFGNVLLSLFWLLGGRREPANVPPCVVPPPLTIVRPLRGLHDRSRAANHALLAQHYAGELTTCFVATRRDDSGLDQARREHGAVAHVSCLVSDPRADVTDKASNMIRGWNASRTPFVAFSDADVELEPDALEQAMGAFTDPRVAAVFSPVAYRPTTFVQRLSGLIVSNDKLVTVRALDRFGALSVMEGGLMIVRRSAVDRIGSLDELLVGTIADDLRLATRLTEQGNLVRATRPIVHPLAHVPLAAVLRQYHRWMVCMRAERPSLLLLQILLHPVAVPLIAVCVMPRSRMLWMLLLASAIWRIVLSLVIDRAVVAEAADRARAWCLLRPLSDLLHFSVGVAALVRSRVHWAGRDYDFRRRPVAGGPRKARVLQS